LQHVLGKAADGAQQPIGKLAANRRTDLRHMLDRRHELVAIATEQGFPFWGALGTICRGWVRAKGAHVIEGHPSCGTV
jgi:hypothetical protein